MKERLDTLPEGSRVVVRANGKALELNSHQLAHHLDSALERAWKRWDPTC